MPGVARSTPPPAASPVREVFGAFAKLGVSSFGGPIAHLGYFRDEFVTRRRWLADDEYADLVALCQFLPGPASSQVGFALGWLRAGARGALVAWTAFTLPSALLMVGVAFGATLWGGALGAGIITGLQVAAVAVVAQAVWGMARTLTPDARRAGIALGAALLTLFAPLAGAQIVAIALGAASGVVLCRAGPAPFPRGVGLRMPRRVGIAALALCAALLVGLPVAAASGAGVAVEVAAVFFRAGALVFGGGHVVLPLLEPGVVAAGWLTPQEFLAGYGAAQALPGPLFAVSAYLGAFAAPGAAGLVTAAIALVAVFLPGMLLLIGVLPFWDAVRRRPRMQAGMRGANAAVVGILAAALYDPVFTGAITGVPTFALGLVCFVLLVAWRTPPWVVVLVGALGGVMGGLLAG